MTNSVRNPRRKEIGSVRLSESEVTDRSFQIRNLKSLSTIAVKLAANADPAIRNVSPSRIGDRLADMEFVCLNCHCLMSMKFVNASRLPTAGGGGVLSMHAIMPVARRADGEASIIELIVAPPEQGSLVAA